MGLFKSKKNSMISDYFKLVNDVGQFKANNAYEVSLYDEYLELSGVGGQSVKLKYQQVTDVFYGLETEIVEKNKSIIGRAVTGGLLFGGVGAVVGAVSGTGVKKKTVKKFIFIISYKSTSGDDAFLTFEDTRMYKGAKVAKMLKELTNINESTGEFL